MNTNIDQHTLDNWYVVEGSNAITPTKPRITKLLGEHIEVIRIEDGSVKAYLTSDANHPNKPLKTIEKYGYVWVTLSNNPKEIFDIPEFDEPRRLAVCGAVRVRTSPARIVENFLDLAHFPFVHTGTLGAEPETQVKDYKTKIDKEKWELLIEDCSFFQPQAAASSAATGGQESEYTYRVPHHFSAILYKTCPEKEGFFDMVGIYAQPLDETECDVHAYVWVYDENSTDSEMIQFQQGIFLQDRAILENQIPAKLPMDPRAEVPNKADVGSIQYRRMLREMGITYGLLTT